MGGGIYVSDYHALQLSCYNLPYPLRTLRIKSECDHFSGSYDRHINLKKIFIVRCRVSAGITYCHKGISVLGINLL